MKNFKLGLLGLVTAALPVLLFLQGKKIAENEKGSKIAEEALKKAKYDSLCIAFDFQVQLAAFYRDNRNVQAPAIIRSVTTPRAIDYRGQIDNLSETLRYGIDAFKPGRSPKGDPPSKPSGNDSTKTLNPIGAGKTDSLRNSELDFRDRQISQILDEMVILERQIEFLKADARWPRRVFRSKPSETSVFWESLLTRYRQLTDRLYKISTPSGHPTSRDSLLPQKPAAFNTFREAKGF